MALDIVEPKPGKPRYRTAEGFSDCARQFQWTLGFDATPIRESDSKVVMICGTAHACTFTVQCDFNPVRGGWVVSPSRYCPTHNHSAPHIPIDAYSEAVRRASLADDDKIGKSNPGFVKSTEITRLVLSINPTFVMYLPSLEEKGINNMSIQELVDMSSSNLSSDLRRKSDSHPPMAPILELHIAELLEGFRLARKRKEEGEATWDGRIVRGVERERLLGVIQEAMRRGKLAMKAAGVEAPTV